MYIGIGSLEGDVLQEICGVAFSTLHTGEGRNILVIVVVQG